MSQLKQYLEAFKNLNEKGSITIEYQPDGYKLTIQHESLWSSEIVESIMYFDLDGKDLADYSKPRQLK